MPLMACKPCAGELGVSEKHLTELARAQTVPGYKKNPDNPKSEWLFDLDEVKAAMRFTGTAGHAQAKAQQILARARRRGRRRRPPLLRSA